MNETFKTCLRFKVQASFQAGKKEVSGGAKLCGDQGFQQEGDRNLSCPRGTKPKT